MYLDLNVLRRRRSFWRRQWAPEATSSQIVFDVTFGMVLPFVGLFAAVWLGPEAASSRPLWAREVLFAGLVTTSQMIGLGSWLAWGLYPALLAGILSVGAVAALAVGVLLLPAGIIGLFAWGSGLFCLVPFVSAFVFARNSRRALATVGPHRRLVLPGVCCGLLLALLIPLLLQRSLTLQAQRATSLVLSPSPTARVEGMRKLRYLGALADGSCIVRAYEGEKDALRREQLRAVYRQLIGREIEDPLFALGE